MEKIRLMVLYSCYYYGGFEIKFEGMIRNWDTERFDLTVVLVYPHYKAKSLPETMREEHRRYLLAMADSVDFIEIPMKSRLGVGVIPRVARVIKEKNIDILYFMAMGSASFIGPPAGKLGRVRGVIRESQTIFDKLYPRILRGLDNWLASMTDCIVVPSVHMKNLLLKTLKVNPEKLVIIPNGVDLDLYGSQGGSDIIRNMLKLNKQARIVGITARLRPVKAHHVLINAIPEILEEAPDTHFVMVGDGPLRGELEELGKKLGVSDNMHFLGHRSDVAALITGYDVGVLCSEVDIHPVSLLEIMSAGVPVVATAVGGIPEIVTNEESGLLVPKGDSVALGKAILRVLKDTQLAARLGKNGRKAVEERFTKEIMMQSIEAAAIRLYESKPPDSGRNKGHAG